MKEMDLEKYLSHLKKDGKYKLTEYADDMELLFACLSLHNAFIKKKKIKKEK